MKYLKPIYFFFLSFFFCLTLLCMGISGKRCSMGRVNLPTLAKIQTTEGFLLEFATLVK